MAVLSSFSAASVPRPKPLGIGSGVWETPTTHNLPAVFSFSAAGKGGKLAGPGGREVALAAWFFTWADNLRRDYVLPSRCTARRSACCLRATWSAGLFVWGGDARLRASLAPTRGFKFMVICWLAVTRQLAW